MGCYICMGCYFVLQSGLFSYTALIRCYQVTKSDTEAIEIARMAKQYIKQPAQQLYVCVCVCVCVCVSVCVYMYVGNGVCWLYLYLCAFTSSTLSPHTSVSMVFTLLVGRHCAIIRSFHYPEGETMLVWTDDQLPLCSQIRPR